MILVLLVLVLLVLEVLVVVLATVSVSAESQVESQVCFIIINIIIIDCFYIALFSALEQTHCARM